MLNKGIILETLDNLAKKIAQKKIIPFFGAGASLPHLNIDWDGICAEMNKETGFQSKDNLAAAQEYVKKFSKTGLSTFLKNYFTIDEFQDSYGDAILFLMSINSNSYYTTNQDNVFEKCFEKYGRKINIVDDETSFANINYNLPILYKFHGNLEKPQTIVFTQDDYKERLFLSNQISSYNPCDIRLLSDCISKSICFIGYSFRDSNIISLFEHLNKVFQGNLPKSYLIEYIPDADFEIEMNRKYNIECINCIELFKNSPDDKNAFLNVINYLNNKVFEFKSSDEIHDIFFSPEYSIIPVATPFEISSCKSLINTKQSLDDIISKVRSITDGKNIPLDLENDIKEIYIGLFQRTPNKEEISNLQGALFNLKIRSLDLLIEILTEYFISLRNIEIADPFEEISYLHLHVPNLPENLIYLCVARSIEAQMQSGLKIKESFLSIIQHLDSSDKIAELTDEAKQYILYHFNIAFSKSALHSNPLAKERIFSGSGPTFNDILRSIKNKIPKTM